MAAVPAAAPAANAGLPAASVLRAPVGKHAAHASPGRAKGANSTTKVISEYYKRATDVAPRWLEPLAFSGNTHWFQGNPDLAIAEQTRVLESEPSFGFANHYLGRALVAKGHYAEGLGYLRKSNELLGSVPFSLGDLGYSLAVAGERAEAMKMRDDLVARRSKSYYPAFPIAAIEAGLGNVNSALEWLERAMDERSLGFYLPSVDPSFDTLRTHPRFKAVMARVRLPSN